MVGAGAHFQLQRLQNEILEAIARGAQLAFVARLLCERAESLVEGVVCSILTVDAAGLLHPLAAPSLPDHYSAAIDNLASGPIAGSCGTAAWSGEPVEVVDIETNPLWADYKALALPLGLRACWSSPIKAGDQRVIGTFAFYYRTRRGPTELDRRIVAACVHLCAIAIEQEEARQQIRRLAFNDTLTGLANRASFNQHAPTFLAEALRAGAVNLLHVDLDDFKSVNDTLGHQIGDLLLVEVADRLRSCVSSNHFLARLGGDEFVIIQPAAGDKSQAAQDLADRIIATLGERFMIEDHGVEIGASIGIASAPADGVDAALLSKRADLALYDAKNYGRGAARFFTPFIESVITARRSLQQDLRAAVGNGDFTLAFQPIVALPENKLIGAEALLRWRHAARGMVPPSQFIPLAEEMSLIEPLGDWALRAACAEAANWPDDVKIAVNLSPLQLRRSGFALDLVRALGDARVRPGRLDLEVTESALLAEEAQTRFLLNQIREIGVGISLDDFGTGYSSLRYLNAFPFNNIKIDRSFVSEVGRRPDATSIVRAIVGLARDLRIGTIAEGVETAAQREWLVAEGCDMAQGYYFGKPAEVANLARFFNASTPAARVAAG